ncbi:hypothetical protein LMH87_009865 [Akanthomyces muscarius]|uniref:Uncharacterized protein n=1 Tax=Akanthomyces muscarius TaxID=2231603 RepID=A0A9W8QCP6_AKAMU|nr:hypothetical protein LMH87_009865 [Akanthomyces muscarius]KAJ4153376.1 hypothetical protein LMH87_009865 [Akanthomyces muscarius]
MVQNRQQACDNDAIYGLASTDKFGGAHRILHDTPPKDRRCKSVATWSISAPQPLRPTGIIKGRGLMLCWDLGPIRVRAFGALSRIQPPSRNA